MYTSEINKVLQRNPKTMPKYVGCFSADRIPAPHSIGCAGGGKGRYPHCMVVNTDVAAAPGSHWIALFAPSPQEVDYFDSLAEWPPTSPEIAQYLQRHYSHVNRVRLPLQSDRSIACGKHVVYFLHRRCQGWPLERIVWHLARSKSGPDRVVSGFVRRYVFGETVH